MTWLPGFDQVTYAQSLGGDQAEPITKVVWHGTAGWCAEHAFNVYANASKGACPHITAEYAGTGGRGTVRTVTKRRFQHVPLTKSSYSLQRGDANHVCGVQTNRAGVIQIERVGFPDDDVSDDEHRWLGENVLAPILAACPLIPPSTYQGAHRMDEQEWKAWAGGLCGHRNVCCQPDGHHDPPELDLDLILHYALGDIVTPADIEAIAQRTADIILTERKIVILNDAGGQESHGLFETVGFDYEQDRRATALLRGLDSKLDKLAKVAITTGEP